MTARASSYGNDRVSKSSSPEQETAVAAATSNASRLAFSQRLRSYQHTEPLSPQRQSPRIKTESEDTIEDNKTPSFTSPLRKRAASSTKPSPSPKRRKSSGYAPPARYAHLNNLLRDVLEPDLLCVFVGVNPGIATATQGHAYAHPSNMFWKLLHSTGLTDRRCRPEEDRDLPQLYMLGNTNIVERPTKDQSELSKEEMVAGTPILEEKFRRYRPEVVCIVGKGIWEAIWKYRYGRAMKKSEFRWGWQDDRENMGKDDAAASSSGWQGSRVFVATSTSGLAASLRPAEKEAIWKPLGEWVSARRAERLAAATCS